MRQNRKRTGSRRSADDKIKIYAHGGNPAGYCACAGGNHTGDDRKPSDKEASAPTDVSLSSDEDINISSDSSQRRMMAGGAGQTNQYTTDFSQYELKKDDTPGKPAD